MAYINQILLSGNIAFGMKYHSWKYQSEKRPRMKKHQKTNELQKAINARHAEIRDIRYAIHNFVKGDKFIRLSYTPGNYPSDFDEADKRLMSFLKKLKRKYPELKYIANTEEGSRGGLHHHLLIPGDFDLNIIINMWYAYCKGGFHIKDVYSDDIVQLASYFTKGSIDEQVSGGNEKIYKDLRHEHKKIKRMKIHKSRNLEKPPKAIKKRCKSDSWRQEPKTQIIDGWIYDLKPGSWKTGFTAEGYPYASYILIRRCRTKTRKRAAEEMRPAIRKPGYKKRC